MKSQKKQSSTFVNVILKRGNYNSLQIVTAEAIASAEIDNKLKLGLLIYFYM